MTNPRLRTGQGPELKNRWIVWLVYATCWTAALLMPLPGGEPWTVNDIDLKFLFAKGLHIAAYAVLAALSGWLLVPSRLRWLLMLFLASHATATEFLQQSVPGRTGRIEDIGLDLFGIFLGCLASWKLWTHATAESRPAPHPDEPEA